MRASPAWAVALAVADHPHLARLVDVLDGGGPGHVRAVIDPPPGRPLAAWLDERGRIEVGEAVTVLVPVLAVAAHLLRSGVVVTALGTDGVVLDDRGAPVVVAAGVRHLRPGTGPVHDAADAATVFVRQVLRRAGATLAADHAAVTTGPAALDSLLERVQDLAPALPLATPSVPATAVGVGQVTAGPVTPRDAPASPAWLAVLPESDAVLRLAAWWSRGGLRSVAAGLHGVRPRAWALVGVVAACLGAAALLLRPAGETTGAAARPDGPPGVHATDERPHDPPAAGTAGPRTTGGEPGDGGVVPSTRDDAATDAVTGDDPASAGRALLAGRDACLRDLLAACLREVDHEGSPLLAADLAAVAEPAGGAGTATSCDRVDESARWGGTALLTCEGAGTTPASVLVVRTEAGWRLREVVTSREEG